MYDVATDEILAIDKRLIYLKNQFLLLKEFMMTFRSHRTSSSFT